MPTICHAFFSFVQKQVNSQITTLSLFVVYGHFPYINRMLSSCLIDFRASSFSLGQQKPVKSQANQLGLRQRERKGGQGGGDKGKAECIGCGMPARIICNALKFIQGVYQLRQRELRIACVASCKSHRQRSGPRSTRRANVALCWLIDCIGSLLQY